MKKTCIRKSFDEIVRQAISDTYNEDAEMLTSDENSNFNIKCSISYCASNLENTSDVSFFRLPDKNKKLYLEWLDALNNHLEPNIKSIYVCSKHFPSEYFNELNELQVNAVPIMFRSPATSSNHSQTDESNTPKSSVYVKSRRCWVPFCPTKKYYFQDKACTVKEKENIKFHDLPFDKEKRAKWLNALNLDGKNISKSFVICSKHFLETDYKRKLNGEILHLLPNAVPSQNISEDSSMADNTTKSAIKRKLSEEDFKKIDGTPIHRTRYQSKILEHNTPSKKEWTRESINSTKLSGTCSKNLEIIQQINDIFKKEKQNIKLKTFQICTNLLQQLNNNCLVSIHLINEQHEKNLELQKQLEKFTKTDDISDTEKDSVYFSQSASLNNIEIEQLYPPDINYDSDSLNEYENLQTDQLKDLQDNESSFVKISKNKFKCNICLENFTTLSKCNEHFKVMHVNLKCTKCEMKFKTDLQLLRHKLRMHILLFEKEFRKYIEVCPYPNCKKEYPMKTLDYHEHIDSHKGIFPYGCCNYKFKYLPRLLKHLNKKDKIIKCSLENFTVPPYAPTITKSHGIYLIKDDICKIKCPMCIKPIRDFSRYKEHIKSHIKPSAYKCSCNEIFTDFRTLCMHLISSKSCSEENCSIFDENEPKNDSQPKQLIKRRLCEDNNDKINNKLELNPKKFQSNNENTPNDQNKIKEKPIISCRKKLILSNKKSGTNYYKSKSEDISYSCLICIKRFTVNNFFIHLQQNDHKILEYNWLKLNNVKIIKCIQCIQDDNISFDSIYNYLDHLITFHNEFDLKQNMKNVINNTENNSILINNNAELNKQKLNLNYNNCKLNNDKNEKVIVINSLFDLQLNLNNQ